jgi:RHS repeat-associated protein
MATFFASFNGLGHSGELHEGEPGWQLLGNGHRIYSPSLMRFHSPDRLSPFECGGLNAYVYCGGDPVNRVDPTGRSFIWLLIGVVAVGIGTVAAAGVSVQKGDRKVAEPLAWISLGLGIAALALVPKVVASMSRERAGPAQPGVMPGMPVGDPAVQVPPIPLPLQVPRPRAGLTRGRFRRPQRPRYPRRRSSATWRIRLLRSRCLAIRPRRTFGCHRRVGPGDSSGHKDPGAFTSVRKWRFGNTN